MIPGKKEPEEAPDIQSGEEPEFGVHEPGIDEEDPNPDAGSLEGDEGGGGAYGRPREIDDEDEGRHV